MEVSSEEPQRRLSMSIERIFGRHVGGVCQCVECNEQPGLAEAMPQFEPYVSHFQGQFDAWSLDFVDEMKQCLKRSNDSMTAYYKNAVGEQRKWVCQVI